MTTKKLSAGKEVDAWCTKCKLDLGHRIIAMDAAGTMPKRVECRTCNSHHNYYKPKTLPETPGAKSPKPVKSAGPPSTKPKSTAGERAVAAARAEQDRERTWEKLTSGHAPTDFRPYRPTSAYEVGHLLRHPKFGDGYIIRVFDRNKMEAMFRDGPRTLAQSLGG